MAKRKEQSVEETVVLGLLKFIGMIVMLPFQLFKKPSSQAKRNAPEIDFDRFNAQWHEIKELMVQSGPSHFRMAILQADTLVDHALKAYAMTGNTMGERLQAARHLFSDEVYDLVWQAHKLRNRLAHEMESEIMSWEARTAVASFEQGLRELKVLKD